MSKGATAKAGGKPVQEAPLKHLVIGTAGHVDHGKTALIRALTGVETDRLPEEKKRGISIDIGFAHFVLPSGRHAAVIDVPGHEKFVKNMLAGITGVDLVLLVVSADEGVMPQTREHLNILRLLEVKRGLVCLTKKDLVDPDFLELAKEDVMAALRGTFLENAPLVAVSAFTGDGMDELKAELDRLLLETEAKDKLSFSRLPIDRVFTRQGFGTVVTGTLVAGSLWVDQKLEILPQELAVRVRGLHVHGQAVERAEAGQRVAVNLSGIDKDDVHRGDVLVQPGVLRPTKALACRLHLLEEDVPLIKTGTRVHFHTGAAEVLGRVVLLDRDELQPGESALALIRTEEPVVVGRRDHFIIRSYSPVWTIGGGTVLEPHGARYRRHAKETLADLQAKEKGTPDELVASVLRRSGPMPINVPELTKLSGMAAVLLEPQLKVLVGRDEARRVGPEHFVHHSGYQALKIAIEDFFRDFYRQFPLRWGPGREELRRRVLPQCDPKLWHLVLGALAEDGLVVVERDRVAPTGREVPLTEAQQQMRDAMARRFREGGFSPPTPAEAAAGVEVKGTPVEEMVQHLLDLGVLVKIAEDFYLHRDVLEEAVQRIRAYLQEKGKMTMAELRDLLGTSRKWAVPLGEYFDSVKLTRRIGDERVLVG